jgi:hypothetical protein
VRTDGWSRGKRLPCHRVPFIETAGGDPRDITSERHHLSGTLRGRASIPEVGIDETHGSRKRVAALAAVTLISIADLKVNSAQPDASRADEITAAKIQGAKAANRSPDGSYRMLPVRPKEDEPGCGHANSACGPAFTLIRLIRAPVVVLKT